MQKRRCLLEWCVVRLGCRRMPIVYERDEELIAPHLSDQIHGLKALP